MDQNASFLFSAELDIANSKLPPRRIGIDFFDNVEGEYYDEEEDDRAKYKKKAIKSGGKNAGAAKKAVKSGPKVKAITYKAGTTSGKPNTFSKAPVQSKNVTSKKK